MQLANVGGGTAGKIEQGDTITVTYSQTMRGVDVLLDVER